MDRDHTLALSLRTRTLERYECCYSNWVMQEDPAEWVAAETALLLCDVWDSHTCRGAVERLEKMIPRMNAVVTAAREAGVLIVHAPSETTDTFYADHPARKRVLAAPPVIPPRDLHHDDPPSPVNTEESACDTDGNIGKPDGEYPWTRQHAGITLDEDRDAVSERGPELHPLYVERGIRNMIIMGVHTNMCVLGRSFAIKQMVRWGYNVALIRDLTDSMYDPARPPYVSHDEGTRLIVEYIEKFWCPTITSDQLA